MLGHRLVGWVAVAAVVLVACGGDSDGASTSATTTDGGVTGSVAPGEGVIVSPAGAEVISDDGRLTLSFPAGAVADDVAVVVEFVPTGEWPAIMADLDPAGRVYRLEPSGLSFDEPVAFAMMVDIEVGDDGSVAAPLVVVVDDAGKGELVGLDVELDLEAGIAVVTGTIGHFSYFVENGGALTLALEKISPRERLVFKTWEAIGVVFNSSDTDINVQAVTFFSLGDVEVFGATSKPGFTLAPSEIRDFTHRGWKCHEEGDGTYGVSVQAAVGAGLLGKGANALARFAGLDIRVESTAASYGVREFVDVKCVMPVYEASTRSGRIDVFGRMTDPLSSFTLDGTFEGGTATLSFQYGSHTEDPETGSVSVRGLFTYTGGGSGTNVEGNGEYTIEGTLGALLALHYFGEGCADPGGGAPKVCQATDAEISLTPVLP